MSDWSQRLKQIEETGPCECGRTHTQSIDRIVLGGEALEELGRYVTAQGWDSPVVVADPNTAEVGAEKVLKCFPKGLEVKLIVLGTGQPEPLAPDEASVGRLIMEIPPECDGVIALGSGTVNDLVRYTSARLGLQFVSVPTAPSMDGYASSVAPLHIGGFKKTFPAKAPKAIFADTNLIGTAPSEMVAAGFGDIIGKITARMDWQMSHYVTGEYYCPRPLALMEKALGQCLADPEGLGQRKAELIEALMGGLILSGIAIMMTGNSRPASGPEHLLAHYWEVKRAMEGRTDALHGTKVGVATPIAIAFTKRLFAREYASLAPVEAIDVAAREKAVRDHYGLVSDEVLPEARSKWFDSRRLHAIQKAAKDRWSDLQKLAAQLPEPGELMEQLRMVHAAVSIHDISIAPQELHQALLFSKEMRSRFTVFDLAACLGVLDDIAEEITEEFGT